LEFSTSVYEHVYPDSFYPMASSGPRLTADQKNGFLGQILSTIDISALGSLYFHQLRQHVALVHLNLSDASRHLSYGRIKPEDNDSNTLMLPMNNRHSTSAPEYIRYVFASMPSREERQCVAELHVLFSHQFANALEFERLKKMATKDALTTLGNRNAFNESCGRLTSRADRHDEKFGLLVIDLDNFKTVNDTYGHQEGDKVLQAVAAEISSVLRNEDEAFRIGGDEFCCLLDCKQKESLKVIADRINKRIEKNTLLKGHGVSCSIGGAVYRQGDNMQSLFERADHALYQVKAAGKNAYLAA